jgi:hypothetical protein
MDCAINYLIMLHAGRRPTVVIDIQEVDEMMNELNEGKAICDRIAQQ